MALALEIKGLRKRYGKHQALNGLDLQVAKGCVMGLVGRNGAGKTTTMSIAAGLIRAGGGRVDLFGEGPFDAGQHAGRVTLLPQSSRFPWEARCLELLVYYGKLQGLNASDAENRARAALDCVHLTDRAESRVRTLSHGMRCRLMIAQAFLGNPELVLLDEPFSGLDPHEVARLRTFVCSRKGTQTLIISSHNLHEVAEVCDQVAFIENGRALRQSTLDGITHRHQVTKYHLATNALKIEDLCEEELNIQLRLAPNGELLIAEFNDQENSPSEVNARILSKLLHLQVGILEVSIGDSLEREYLKSTGRS